MGIIKNKLIIKMLTKFTKACLFIGVASAGVTSHEECEDAGDKYISVTGTTGYDEFCLDKKLYYKLFRSMKAEGVPILEDHDYVLNLTPWVGGYEPPSNGQH